MIGSAIGDFIIGQSPIGGVLSPSNPTRTYGRITNADGSKSWVEVDADPSGNFDYGYITTLIQVLKLNLGESPFYADWGIPAQPSVMQQIFPDFYVNQIQQRFAKYFSSLTISKVQSPTPTYNIYLVTLQGTVFRGSIPA